MWPFPQWGTIHFFANLQNVFTFDSNLHDKYPVVIESWKIIISADLIQLSRETGFMFSGG